MRTRHILFPVLAALSLSCVSSQRTASPTDPVLFVTPQEAEEALTAAGIAGDCRMFDKQVTASGDQAGSTGVLACDVTVPSSRDRWILKLFASEDDSYAEAGYQRSCNAMAQTRPNLRWWVIWRPGQNWYAEVYDATTDISEAEKPPTTVADTFAAALASTPWDDCSAMEF